jgi:DNA-binding transcriptional ArsR family regulator
VAVQGTKKRKPAPGVNEKVFKVLSHPLRGHIFLLLRERVASPSELAELLGERVEKVAYHCRQMAKPDIGVIELVATDNRRGGTKHYYRATARPLLDTEEWAKIPKPVRELETARSAQLVISDLSAAIREGTFDSHDARSLLRSPMVIDSQGVHESAKVMMDALDKHADIQASANQRLAENSEEGMNFRVILLAFPMPSRP